MSNSVNDIPAGLRVPAQVPLDAKVLVASQSVLANLGPAGNLAYTYHKGMIAYCAQEQTRWEWREPNYPGEIGLMLSNFVYPSGLTVFGINYSNKAYNFFPITLTSVGTNPKILVDSLEMSFDWKKGETQILTRDVQEPPQGYTDNVHVRNGFIGYHKPILVSGVVTHPKIDNGGPVEDDPTLFEAIIYNLGVKVKDFSKIVNYNPTIVISKYTPSTKKKQPNPDPNPILGFPNPTWRKGSYKFSQDNDPVRLTRVPIQAGYQIIDFGQEHYFRTVRGLQNGGSFQGGSLLLCTRAAKYRYSQVSLTDLTSKAFVYLQFHIEITVNGVKYLSKPLGRLKMVAEIKPELGEIYPIVAGDIIPYTFSSNGAIERHTKIYFKHT